MPLKRTRLVRLGAVHAVGLAALAFATPALATDDPPLPVPPAADSPVLASEEPEDVELGGTSADEAKISLVEQESPGNPPPSAPATAQLDRVRQGWSQVISPTHAQKSPERASTGESQRSAAPAPSYERQYHPRHVQYQRPSIARSKPRAPVLPTAGFSSGERSGITRSSSPIAPPNRSRNDSENCALNPGGNWPPDVPADDGEGVECALDPPSGEAAAPTDESASDDPPDFVDCTDAQAQYQPGETQYQPPASTTCVASDDSVVPISEPNVPLPSISGSSDTPAPTSGVSPATTEPLDAPVAPNTVAPSTEPTQPGVEVLPAPNSPRPATTKVEASRFVGRSSRPRPAGSAQRAHTERVIPARARSVSPSLPVRPRPVAPSTKPKTAVSRSKVEATAAQRLEPASSHVNLLGDWLLLVLPLSFVVVLGLLFPAAAIAGRSLRARAGSKGLSDRPAGTSRSRGIRYRD
jgi:hypothetical protein